MASLRRHLVRRGQRAGQRRSRRSRQRPAARCGAAVRFAETLAGGPFVWDRAQVSVCWPGYPQRGDGEGDASFAYRRNRDAAHVDGLLPVGPERRRFLREHHRFILGLPVGPADAAASPFVVWEGSHRIARTAFVDAYGSLPARILAGPGRDRRLPCRPPAHIRGMPAG